MSSVIDDFESAFQSAIAAVTNHGTNHIHDPEEVKTTGDQTIQRFLDSARAVESFFLQKRMYLSTNNPEQIIAEDINDIKLETARKEQVIKRMQEKIEGWKLMLSDQSHPPGVGIPPGAMHPHMMQTTSPGPPFGQPSHMGPGGQYGPNHGAMLGMRSPMMNRPVGPQMGPRAGLPGQFGGPGMSMQPSPPIGPIGQPGVVTQSGQVLPGQHVMGGPNPGSMMQVGSSYSPGTQQPQFGGQRQPGPPQLQPPQSPLESLERTTSSIGLPDSRANK